MTRNEFLERLRELLSDLPPEEYLEAVRYYEDYFADAGPEAEAEVLRELGSPENVAEKIRAGCQSRGGLDEGDAFAENVFAGRGMDDAGEQAEQMRRFDANAGDYENEGGNYESTGRNRGYGAAVRTKSYLTPLLVILALVIGIPVLGPLLIAFCVLMLGFFIGFGVGGVCLIAGGITVLGNALADFSVGTGLVCVLSGGGLILTALGILFVVFAVNCAFRALPAAFRGIRGLMRRLFGKREV